ncbi:hypothetical protein [Nannocystis pusilla]|uniref:hypothetical protein n=1 Tax=Nannocystis pusilla TaxID=889268 RepID=UPI003B7B1C66
MHYPARQRALSTSCGPQLLSGRRLAALVLVPLLALACGGPGDPVTSQTASDPTTTTDETSAGSTSSSTTTDGPVTGAPSPKARAPTPAPTRPPDRPATARRCASAPASAPRR